MSLPRASLSAPAAQAGLTLIELMVSIAIGLVISLAAALTYLNTADAGRVAEATGRMNEDAQAALIMLTQQLRMAGSNPIQPDRAPNSRQNPLTNPFAFRGCDSTFTDVRTATSTAALTCAGGTGTSSISVAYEGDRFNTVATSTGAATDCLGSAVPTTSASITNSSSISSTVTVAEVENRFFIGTSTGIVSPSLYCKGNAANTTAQPLVENIEDMQILYGLDNPGMPNTYGSINPGATTTNAILGYMTAAQLLADTNTINGTLPGFSPTYTLAGLTEVQRWAAVKSVRVCVLVRSAAPVFETPARYVDCQGTVVLPTDRRMRRAYTTTLLLRNR